MSEERTALPRGWRRIGVTAGDFVGEAIAAGTHGLETSRGVLFDGDGELTVFDFLSFLNAFGLGCP